MASVVGFSVVLGYIGLLACTSLLLAFLARKLSDNQSVYDVLPSPANLHTWGLADSPECRLCQRRGTMEHILSCCPKALGDGQYRWHHEQILKSLADSIYQAVQYSKTQASPKQSITFISEGQKARHQPSSSEGLLASRDWQLQANLGRQLTFPTNIVTTSLCADLVLTSESTKQLVLLELTVPWENRIEEANERKRAKYAELITECWSNGWNAYCEPVEAGCRGFAGHSLQRTLKLLGVRGLQLRRASKNILEAAEKASQWLWICGAMRQLDTSQGLITPGWVARARVSDDLRPETPCDPRVHH